MFKLIRKNFYTLIGFEIINSVIIWLLILPVLRASFSLSLAVCDIAILTQENMLNYFINPLSLLILLFMLLLATLVTMFEIYAINYIYVYTRAEKAINVKSLMIFTAQKMRILFSPQNFLLFVYICLVLPFAGLVYNNSLISELSVPGFIMQSIKAQPVLYGVVIGISVLLFAFGYFNMYTLMYMFNENTCFIPALKKSYALTKRTFFKLIWQFIKMAIILTTIFLVFLLTEDLFLNFAKTSKTDVMYVLYTSLILFILVIFGSVYEVVVKIVFMYIVAESFYENEPMLALRTKTKSDIKVSRWLYVTGSVLLFVVVLLVVAGTEYLGDYTALSTQVMAHRGSSVRALENTKEAFVLAVSERAKYIELDVTLTKDNEVVILHDLDLKRLTGVDGKVRDMTLTQLQKLTVYSSDGELSGKIMTLKELLPLINQQTILNIELKPAAGDEAILAQQTEEIIKRTPRHMVCSLNSDALIEIKRLNGRRLTCYVMAVALGDYSDLYFADSFSLEASYVNEKTSEEIHSMGKKIFVWTINDVDDAERYYDMGVDAIITDYPKEMGDKINELFINKRQRRINTLFDF